jgi:hypothetical protein
MRETRYRSRRLSQRLSLSAAEATTSNVAVAYRRQPGLSMTAAQPTVNGRRLKPNQL